ncbi:MAG TPA: NAD(P)H-dependent dehydrogenase/reductase [Desulfobacterales bacterium]|nr:NAD(P)H-dependent dehydrogenase/reductase [Desulfobacterales bacterium]HIP38238.1 NAD(P)H-dependent dehydrogenase/reductase [Desulfocapsa sulfexigens]
MFIDLLRKRRSIRVFQDKEVEKEKIDLLMEAMLRAPSSRSLNPWEFVVVQNRETINALSKAKPHGSAFMKNAKLAIVICADPEKCDVWIEDCSIASLLLHLQATDLDLGSCWVQIRLREHNEHMSAEEYVADILGLKEGMVVEAIIAIGYPAKESTGHPESSLLKDRVSFERYGEKG